MRLLLDEHFPRGLAVALRRQLTTLDAVSIHETMLGGLKDPPLLEVLDAEHRSLITRDVNSIPRHVRARLAAGQTHGGIIYAESKWLRQKDARALIRRSAEVVKKHSEADWTCRERWL